MYSKLTAGEIIQPVNNFVHFFSLLFYHYFFFVLVKYTYCGSNISSCFYLKKIAYISSSFLKMLKSLLYNCVEIYNSKCCPPRKLENLYSDWMCKKITAAITVYRLDLVYNSHRPFHNRFYSI